MAAHCSYEVVAGLVPATPQKIKDYLISMRSDLLRVITQWEQSGQGEGSFEQEEEEDHAPNQDVDPQANINHDESMMLRMSASTISSTEGGSFDDKFPHTNIGSLYARPCRAPQN